MYKYNQIFGMDISKDVFDVMSSEGKHLQFENSSKGFNQLTKHLTKKDLIVMEATGYYHYCLAQYLYDLGYIVSVVNPLAVKRFVQMKLSKIKTDKSDALAICQYASLNEVPIFTSRDSNQAECLQLMSLIEIYLKQSAALKNKVHGEKTLGIPSKTVYHSLNRSLKLIQKEVQLLENKLL